MIYFSTFLKTKFSTALHQLVSFKKAIKSYFTFKKKLKIVFCYLNGSFLIIQKKNGEQRVVILHRGFI